MSSILVFGMSFEQFGIWSLANVGILYVQVLSQEISRAEAAV